MTSENDKLSRRSAIKALAALPLISLLVSAATSGTASSVSKGIESIPTFRLISGYDHLGVIGEKFRDVKATFVSRDFQILSEGIEKQLSAWNRECVGMRRTSLSIVRNPAIIHERGTAFIATIQAYYEGS